MTCLFSNFDFSTTIDFDSRFTTVQNHKLLPIAIKSMTNFTAQGVVQQFTCEISGSYLRKLSQLGLPYMHDANYTIHDLEITKHEQVFVS